MQTKIPILKKRDKDKGSFQTKKYFPQKKKRNPNGLFGNGQIFGKERK
jgi:hypothetical protein